MNKENTFKVIDKDGKEIEFEILFTFESDETNKNYEQLASQLPSVDGSGKKEGCCSCSTKNEK